MRVVNQGIAKIDAKALLSGKPVYTNDLAPQDCLIVKVLRSPYAYAKIKVIDTTRAKAIEGIECVLTYHDVPQQRFTNAGQTYPEPSPYDRLILEDTLRYIGDAVAIVAGCDSKTVDRALKAIKVEYEVLEPILDFESALDNQIIVHAENDIQTHFDIGFAAQRNLCAAKEEEYQNFDQEYAACPVQIEETYYTSAQAQTMMETFRTYTYLDQNQRLTVVSSTQIPFHVRRILARALNIPAAKIRVIKPRIGGGFGAKQTAVSEFYPAIVTWLTGKAAKIIYTRQECFTASNSRHQMRITVKLGSDLEGNIKAIAIDTLSNTGAYGEHGCTTVGLSGSKPMTIYNKANAFKFTYHVVYTNTMPAAAFRGYGASQGIFALESAVNQLADRLQLNPADLRLKNIVSVGENLKMYDGANVLNSCNLDRCIATGRKMIDWDKKYPAYRLPNGKIRALGMALSLQGSGIAGIDAASAEIRLNDDGYYSLLIGATDMGTGCDTILCQMAAECLDCEMEKIIVSGVDTDYSPFDPGSYASSTTYVTGMAVVKACEDLLVKIKNEGAKHLGLTPEQVDFDGTVIYAIDGEKKISLNVLAQNLAVGVDTQALRGVAANCSPVSPPPVMAGFVEVEIDPETYQVFVCDMVGVLDCGTVINPHLATVQAEGGMVQGLGWALCEDMLYTERGKMMTNSLLQYKIPARSDVGQIRVAFEPSYEPTGPYGAKSIGEICLNTSAPAVSQSIYNGLGVYMRHLPMTPSKIFMEIKKNICK